MLIVGSLAVVGLKKQNKKKTERIVCEHMPSFIKYMAFV